MRLPAGRLRNGRASCAALDALSMLKKAPLSTSNGTSVPSSVRVAIGRKSTMRTGICVWLNSQPAQAEAVAIDSDASSSANGTCAAGACHDRDVVGRSRTATRATLLR